MKVLIVTNKDAGLYKFRKELIEELVKQHDVFICLPYGEYVDVMREMGCRFVECKELKRHGTDLLPELRLIRFYQRLFKKLKPDIVLTYTIKPNIYAGMVSAYYGMNYVTNITGLGTALEHEGWMQKLILQLYKIGLKKSYKVFFQNRDNLHFFIKKRIVKNPYGLLPGSGVNLQEYQYMDYPDTDDIVVFLIIGRIMRDKGSDEILEAADKIKQSNKNVVFRMIGECDEEHYVQKIARAVKDGQIDYVGFQTDIRPFLKESHATIHASYHEGMSNVLLETAACGRPIIATDVPGCRDTFTPGQSGIAFQPGDTASLVSAIRQFLQLTLEEKRRMGKMGRRKVEAEFDRRIVIDAYLNEIYKVSVGMKGENRNVRKVV